MDIFKEAQRKLREHLVENREQVIKDLQRMREQSKNTGNVTVGEYLGLVENLGLFSVSKECEHPYMYVHTRCMGEINRCIKCGEDL